MKKLLPIFLILTVAATLAFVTSCSDDKGNNDNNNEVTQAQAMVIDSLNEQMLPIAIMAISAGLGRMDGVTEDDYVIGLKKAASPDHDSVFLTYHTETGWWDAYVIYESDEDGGDSLQSLSIRDSLQFRNLAGDFQMEPNDSTDYFRNKSRFNVTIDNYNTEGAVSLTTRSDLTYADLQSTEVNVDGAMSLTIAFEDIPNEEGTGTISGSMTISMDVDELNLPVPETPGDLVCPQAGVLTYTLTENFSSQEVKGENQTVTWTITITISDQDTYQIELEAEGQTFTMDPIEGVCNDGLGTSLFSHLGQLVKARR